MLDSIDELCLAHDKKGGFMAERGVNKVILIGRLGTDPEMKYTNTGTPVCNLNIATSETWLDKDGQKKDRTEWHRIVVWSKLAQVCGEYLKKGRQVYVEGRLQTRSWQDKSGNKRYTTEIIANSVQFLGSQDRKESSKEDLLEDSSFVDIPSNDAAAAATDEDIPF